MHAGVGALALVWLFVVIGLLDTVNAIVQSMRVSVFNYPLGVNWVIVAIYVPALLVSSFLIFMQLLRSPSGSVRDVRHGAVAGGGSP